MPSRESLISTLLIALKDIVSVNITKTEEPDIASTTGTYGNFIIAMIITILLLLSHYSPCNSLRIVLHVWHTCMFQVCPLRKL